VAQPPKAAAGNERKEVPGGGDVEGYEQLRQRALCGDATGWRLGLAVLEHRGVAAWLRVRRDGAGPPTRSIPTRPAQPASLRGAEELVEVLAAMALGVLA
jgi:hypothetical protein